MIWFIFLFIIATWVVCGFVSSGFTYAFFQRAYPELADGDRVFDAKFAIGLGFAGPIALLVSLIECDMWRSGWSLPGSRLDREYRR